jgi:hypothetical protein
MNKPTRRRRAACRAAARTLAIATVMAALVTTLGAGQALAGPDERVLERQGRIDRQAAAAQADKQSKATERSRHPAAETPRRFIPPEPPMDTSPRLNIDEPVAPDPAPPAPASDRTGLVISLAVAALLLAVGAATTWRLHHRRPRPQPTS